MKSEKIEKHMKTRYKQSILIRRFWNITIRGLILLLLTNGAVWMPMHHTAHAARDSAPAPTGYWKFDEGSGTTANDSSGNNNPGAITAAAWTTGEVNGALSFSGTTNYVSMGTPTALKFGAGSFTIISWFKTTATAFQRMVNMGMNNWDTGFELSLDETGSCPTTPCITAALGGGSAGASISFGTTAHTFADGNWHQAALVVDRTAKTAQLYVDGVVQAVTERTGTCTSGTAVTNIDISGAGCSSLNATSSGSTEPFTVGDLLVSGTSTNPFTGSLDEVRAYNSALSSGQIANQYGIDTQATPTGYWKFDEGSGTTANDSSGNNNPGAITGATWTTGQVNGALSFTGTTNYVSMGTPPALKFGLGSFTVISWFKTTATVMGRIVSMGVSSFSTGFDLGVNVTNTCSAGCVGAELGGGTQGTSVSFGTTATTFNTGVWHQAAMVINQTANTGQLYVDGAVQALAKQTNTCGTVSGTSIDITACSSASATAASDPFTVGAYHGSSTIFPFTGSLDEVRVYNTALSSAQIANQYSIDTGATPAGYWQFDEGSGTTANDSSGNNNPGAITGATWTTGQVNGALSFSGSSNYVSMGTPPILRSNNTSFTIISWFNSTSTAHNRIAGSGLSGFAAGFEFGLNTFCTGCVGGDLGANGIQGNTVPFATTTTFNDGKWHQAAMVIDQTANTGQIYVDGVAQPLTKLNCGTVTGTTIAFSACASVNTYSTTEPFIVGAYKGSGGTNELFTGSLDEVRFYNSALNSAQILNQYTLDATTINPQAISVYGQGTGNVFNTNATGTTSSTFNGAKRVVLDSSGGLYAADYGNNRVLYFPSGAKTATRVYGQNATGTNFTVGTPNTGGISATTLNGPNGLALDSAGNLYVTDGSNNRVLFYPISGGIAAVTPTRVYGQGTAGNVFNAAAASTSASGLNNPSGITLDSQNNLYVADASNNRVIYFPSAAGVAGTAAFTATRVYGQGISFTTGTANQCSCTTDSALTMDNPRDVAVDSSGDLYVADNNNNRVIYYPTWTANNMAATRVYGQTNFTGFAANQGGVITATTLDSPFSLALDSNGDLYVSDQLNNRVLYYPTWTANPMVATRVYGQSGSFTTGTANYCSCTTDNNSSLSLPWGIYLDPTGHLYVTDFTNNRILEFWTHLTITTQPPASTAATSIFSLATSLIDDGSQLVFTHFTGAVSVAITSGTAGATLSGTTSVNAVSGVATFSNLSIDKGGAGYILTTSYPSVGSAATNGFTITGSLLFTPLTSPSFAFTLTGATGTVTSQRTFKVNDTTGSGVGWHVTTTSTQFISGSKTLPTTALTITGVSTACTAGQTCVVPVNGVNTYPITVPAATTAPAAISYFSANGNTGTGDVTLTVTYSLSIPPGTAAGTYTSTVTDTVVNASSYFLIVNNNSGSLADVSGASQADGGIVLQYAGSGGANEAWQIIDVGGGYDKFIVHHSGKALDVSGSSLADSANIVQNGYTGLTSQQWQLVSVGGSFFKIVNRNSGKVVDVPGAVLTTVTLDQLGYTGATSQQWKFVPFP